MSARRRLRAAEGVTSTGAASRTGAFAAVLLLIACIAAPLAAQPQPEGGQFQINAYTTSHQSAPSVARTPDGGFVVWHSVSGSLGGDLSGDGIQGRR